MSTKNKDSAEVVLFMTAFARLKEWCDDAPEDLKACATADSSIRDLCTKVFDLGNELRRNERRHRALYTAPVDPVFIREWRDFESRYEVVLSELWLADISPYLACSEPVKAAPADAQWINEDDEADFQARGVQESIEFAQFNAVQSHRWDEEQQNFIRHILEGVAAWERLKQDTGFDLRGVFRRRALVPFILVPRRIAARHGSEE
ncbi:MAG: hypothetical protein FJW38_31165, partial [Acidobacteria bacterium]|nr:hypothetical protein [Acidobacteriota bacterium]